MKIAIIGAGISGITSARMLCRVAEVTVFEASDKIGGLIRCDRLRQGLYHRVGGHVFNTQNPEVAQWFWQHFDRESEFIMLQREARILFGDEQINYPIENHLYQLPEQIASCALQDLLALAKSDEPLNGTLKGFLERTFGETLCNLYFLPYNEKIWRTDLSQIPLAWLEGKLPMPSLVEILNANILRSKERRMVHSQFYYPRSGGSQFIVDRLAEGVQVRINAPVSKIERVGNKWRVQAGGIDEFDVVLYTGDIRRFGTICEEARACKELAATASLYTRGIKNVFCECDETSTSWLYIPEKKFSANRIIYTGRFSSTNNSTERMTCVLEFAYNEEPTSIANDIARLPGRLVPIAMTNTENAYVIQKVDTRAAIAGVKQWGSERGIYFTGRFAEWEYYNMDKCIEASARVAKSLGVKVFNDK